MSALLACTACDFETFYEKLRCPDCGNDSFEQRDPGTGTLLSRTRVHVTPAGVREPNHLGLASFGGGTKFIAQLVDGIDIGDEVRVEATDARSDGEHRPESGLWIVPAGE